MAKRHTPEWEIERLGERLLNTYPQMKSKNMFDTAFNEYVEPATQAQKTLLRNKVWNFIKTQKPERFIDDKEEVKRIKKKIKVQKPKRKLPFIGKVRGKIAYVSEEKVTVGTKTVVRYRDRYGRFAMVIKK
jgi:hypothetical protein